jgi:hypothetical protein
VTCLLENSMKKQFAIAAGLLLTLATAFSDTVRTQTPSATPAASVEVASADINARASAQVVSMWKDYAKPGGSRHFARPL